MSFPVSRQPAARAGKRRGGHGLLNLFNGRQIALDRSLLLELGNAGDERYDSH